MPSGNGVPFVDLISPHRELEQELVEAAREIIGSAAFIGGAVVERFEESFAEITGTKYAVGVGSGTDALRFALIAAGVRSGDLVVTVPNTFAATVEAILQAGATPRLVDVDPDTLNMSPKRLRAFIETECETKGGVSPVHRDTGQSVTAIVPVHLYGQMCDMDPIVELTREYGLTIVEDACQAHGARHFSDEARQWQNAGSVGATAAFSFYPGKNLGACGEAGAVTTNDSDIADRVRVIRDHGQSRKYYHELVGYNGRLDAIQAALLNVKLPHLASWNRLRRDSAAAYNELLAGAEDILVPVEPEWSRAVYHLYVIRTHSRDALQRYLTEKKIGTGLHYPVPIHLQPAYASLGYESGSFPISEAAAEQVLSLPLFPQLQPSQREFVAETVLEFCARSQTPIDSRVANARQ